MPETPYQESVTKKKSRKRFGANTKSIAKAITQGEHAEAQTTFRNTLIACEDIIIDETNPRDLALTPQDVIHGVSKLSKDHARKHEELIKIKALSESIKKESLLQPIVVYKKSDKYEIVAGERRYLATLFAKKRNIEARVYIEKPNRLSLKLAQWSENNQREDLTLFERINNVRDLIVTYEEENKKRCQLNDLMTITGLSESQCSAYLQALKLDSEVTEYIRDGVIDNLDKALCIQSVENRNLKTLVIDAAISGASLKNIRKLIREYPQSERKNTSSLKNTSKKRGRKAQKVNVGEIKNISVIKEIVGIFSESKKYQKEASLILNTMDISDYDAATQAIQELLKIIEVKIQ